MSGSEEPLTAAIRSTTVLALLGAFALAAAGCGDTTIDDVKAEGAIQKSLETSLHEKISAVDCPSGQKVESGKTFTCAVDFPKGEEATATLKILNQEADVKLVGLKAKKQRGEERGE
jgi:hypothetical protein